MGRGRESLLLRPPIDPSGYPFLLTPHPARDGAGRTAAGTQPSRHKLCCGLLLFPASFLPPLPTRRLPLGGLLGAAANASPRPSKPRQLRGGQEGEREAGMGRPLKALRGPSRSSRTAATAAPAWWLPRSAGEALAPARHARPARPARPARRWAPCALPGRRWRCLRAGGGLHLPPGVPLPNGSPLFPVPLTKEARIRRSPHGGGAAAGRIHAPEGTKAGRGRRGAAPQEEPLPACAPVPRPGAKRKDFSGEKLRQASGERDPPPPSRGREEGMPPSVHTNPSLSRSCHEGGKKSPADFFRSTPQRPPPSPAGRGRERGRHVSGPRKAAAAAASPAAAAAATRPLLG